MQVREALQGMQDGSFAKCIDCGRAIEPPGWQQFLGRLTAAMTRKSAITWRPYAALRYKRRQSSLACN